MTLDRNSNTEEHINQLSDYYTYIPNWKSY